MACDVRTQLPSVGDCLCRVQKSASVLTNRLGNKVNKIKIKKEVDHKNWFLRQRGTVKVGKQATEKQRFCSGSHAFLLYGVGLTFNNRCHEVECTVCIFPLVST